MPTTTDNLNDSHCPLCNTAEPKQFASAFGRAYLSCSSCALVFVSRKYLLKPDVERARYELHQNNPDDPNYRQFLNRLAEPLCEMLSPGAKGLDFGCGPGPTLSVMLAERNYEVSNYDPYFFPDDTLLESTYDFVTCTEVIEHLYRPAEELDRMLALLRPSGILAIMTEMKPADEKFTEWHYIREPTHVNFFSDETMRWIGTRWDLSITAPHRNVRLCVNP